MARPPLLFVTQRLPWPPNKGEKIRSHRFLTHLVERFDVHLGCCIDDPADTVHIPAVRDVVASLHVAMIPPGQKLLRAVPGFIGGAPLSFAAYTPGGLRRWVRDVMRSVRPEVGFIYSSNAAPVLLDQPERPQRVVMDLVDVDSVKFEGYAAEARGLMRMIYQVEARRVATAEAHYGGLCNALMLVSEPEAALFNARNPALAARVHAIPNGVDLDRFDPDLTFDPPFDVGPPTFVFTGAMDYKPNADAVVWFATQVMPLLRAGLGNPRFVIVGANPTPAVQRLAAADVTVTGRVVDARPYIAHATVSVAPLRIGRGLQNKVIEALALARPTVVSPQALEGLPAQPDRDLIAVRSAQEWAHACIHLCRTPVAAQALGWAGRRLVEQAFSWSPRLAALDQLLVE
jgi:sugar transferase (PEP-CTERM/EpsH1 system associated)